MIKLQVTQNQSVSGRLATMRVFAQMHDFLGYSNCLENNPGDDVPDDLVPFTIRSLIFTGNSREQANKLAQTLVLEESSSDRQLVVASILEELGQDHQVDELLGQIDQHSRPIQDSKYFNQAVHESKGLPIRLRYLGRRQIKLPIRTRPCARV